MCSLQTLATFSAMFSEYVELPFPRFYGFCLYDDFEHSMAINEILAFDCKLSESENCPSGHELVRCRGTQTYTCRQCGPLFYQPDRNRYGDKCRLRRFCDKPHTKYKSHGSTTKNADCMCDEGYHFENEDQRACVPNRVCDKEYGQSKYGICIRCIDHNMYSDTIDNISQCKPQTNCEKQGRCTVHKSDGSVDNVCGPKVVDVHLCDDPRLQYSRGNTMSDSVLIAGSAVGSVLFLLMIFVLAFALRRRHVQKLRSKKPLSINQMEELKMKILKECEEDGELCKKVLCKSFFVVEERIERQVWSLAQELFRHHPMQDSYELIVLKYKESHLKFAVNGYLREWTEWRTENKQTIEELFRCLRHCKRDDIVYDICSSIGQDVGFQENSPSTRDVNNARNKNLFLDSCLCCRHKLDNKPTSPFATSTVQIRGNVVDVEARGHLLDLRFLKQSIPPPDLVVVSSAGTCKDFNLCQAGDYQQQEKSSTRTFHGCGVTDNAIPTSYTKPSAPALDQHAHY